MKREDYMAKWHPDDDHSSELVAAIVQQNVDQSAATANDLINYYKQRLLDVSTALVELFEAIDQCQVVDRRLLKAQQSGAVYSGLLVAERALEDEESPG